MSILGSFFNRGFMASKCKTLLKLTIPRIKLLRNRREIQLKQMRRDIAKLLETCQEATARIRVEHIIREENMIAAQEIIELFCELIVVRLPIIESQRECPLDLKEAISSICFAAPRCADLPELLQVQLLFASKYGKEFVSAATELMPDCGVNRQLIELLSVHAPSPEKKLNLLKEIAAEHEIDWDPAASETELFQKQEDLLNGQTQISTEPKLLLPEEKHNETSYSAPDQPDREQPDSDSDSDSGSGSDTLEFPEVPQPPVLSNLNVATAPEMATPPVFPHREVEFLSSSHSGIIHKDEPQTSARMDNKQFVPFISPPFVSPESSNTRHGDSLPSLMTKSEADVDLKDVLDAAQAAAETAERAAAAARSAASLAEVRINELTKRNVGHETDSTSENPFHTGGSHHSATTKMGLFSEQNTSSDYDGNFMNELESHKDYNPAPSAASLEQVHNSDLTKKKSLCETDDASENPFYANSANRSIAIEGGLFSEQNTFSDYDDHGVEDLKTRQANSASPGPQSSSSPSNDTIKAEHYSSLPNYGTLDDRSSSLRFRNLPSMEDDLYSSYPNLFTFPNSNNGPQTGLDNHHSNS
ncbi:uncharacterized protein LOC129292063 [Prosopis cineraria]|uniref:uncharacterized protein LOC129292063 n=1 Tax=Prosopis cineraria TaxID=364024 RepID=UPI00240F5048|nr:uncharacterized protein LOC129292063 [Prosopis cineraria]